MQMPCTSCDGSAQRIEVEGANRRVFGRRLGLTTRAASAIARPGMIGLAALVAADSGTAHASDVIPGIKHYEVLLPEFTVGPDGQASVTLSDSSKNMAGDISDRGLIAGRVDLTDPGLRAFVWSMVPQFGVAPLTVTWLPMPSDDLSRPFPTSEAFDVSEHGVVLGGVGPITSLGPPEGGAAGTSDWNPRGVLWRLGAESGGGATWQRIDPPSDEIHGYWPQGAEGTTVLEAISAELPLRAVGYAGSNFSCFGGGVGQGRPAAIAISFPAGGIVPEYWTDPRARQFGSGAPKARLLGLSRRSEFLVGAQSGTVGCDVDPSPLGIECAPTRWDRLTAEDQTALTPTAFGADVPPRERVTAEVRAASRVGSGSADGIGVGYIFRFNNLPLGRFPQAWKLPAVPQVDPEVPQAQPLQLPFVPGSNTIGGIADDIEGARWLSGASAVPSHIAVGASEIAPSESGTYQGTLWYWSGASWTPGAWAAIDVNAPGVLADGWKTDPSDRVERLRGVNQWGDCAGTAIVSGVRRPVVLRAIRLIGDLDIDDCVGASDLAILLGAWCAGENCTESSFASDLNRDGVVGAPDLSALLANWGSGEGCPTGAVESPVPALVAAASKGNVDFAAYIVGLEDIDGYRAWAATAPPGTVQVIDEVMWLIAKSRQEAGAQ
jgi:hypothetical protein